MKPPSGKELQDGLAASGGGYGMFAGVNGVDRLGRVDSDGLRGGEKRESADIGNSAAMGEGDTYVGVA